MFIIHLFTPYSLIINNTKKYITIINPVINNFNDMSMSLSNNALSSINKKPSVNPNKK